MGMKRVFRYTVPVDDNAHTFDLAGPVVHVAYGRTLSEVDFWAEHSEGLEKIPHRFQVFGTGQPLPNGAYWVGTCLRTSGLVWHLYELDRGWSEICLAPTGSLPGLAT